MEITDKVIKINGMRYLITLKNSIIVMSLLIVVALPFSAFADPLSGSVKQEDFIQQSRFGRVVDSGTGKPVSGADIMIPSRGIIVKSDQDGRFDFSIGMKGPVIVGVKASGYKPFSVTIDESGASSPISIAVSKDNGRQIVIDTKQHHLGDNNYSEKSANASQFALDSAGDTYTKEFFVEDAPQGSKLVLKVGSVIGVDTQLASKLRQNRISSYSSPTKVYLNNKKIGEIRINGDNQEMPLPAGVLMNNAYNQIAIETGKNQFSFSKPDFDDIEFMNLTLEFK